MFFKDREVETRERIDMRIILTKEEFKDFAIKALASKYKGLIPEDMDCSIDARYNGEVEIDVFEKATKEEAA